MGRDPVWAFDMIDGRVAGVRINIQGASSDFLALKERLRELRCKACKKEICGSYHVFSQFGLAARILYLVVVCDECTKPVKEAIKSVVK